MLILLDEKKGFFSCLVSYTLLCLLMKCIRKGHAIWDYSSLVKQLLEYGNFNVNPEQRCIKEVFQKYSFFKQMFF